MRKLFYIAILFSLSLQGQVVDRFARFAATCTPDPNEVHTQSNAASDPNCNESNNVTGWTAFSGAGLGTTDALTAGAKAMTFTQDGSPSGGERAFYEFSATIGHSYAVTAWARVISGTTGGTPAWKQWTGVVSSPSVSIGLTLVELDVIVEASGTTVQARIYPPTTVADAVIAWDEFSVVALGDLGFHSLHKEHYIEFLIKGWHDGQLGFILKLIAKREDEDLA